MNYSYVNDVPTGPWEFALYKDCGNGNLVKQGLECPISTVKLVDDAFEIQRMAPLLKPMMIDIEYSLNEPRCYRSFNRPERSMPQGAPKDYPFLLQPNIGCSDSMDDDFAIRLGQFLERELYEANELQNDFSANLYLYDYFLNAPGNIMRFYTYHTFGFRHVSKSDQELLHKNHAGQPQTRN